MFIYMYVYAYIYRYHVFTDFNFYKFECYKWMNKLLLECIVLNSRNTFFSSKLRSLTVLSHDPVAIYYPSYENATLFMKSKNKLDNY